MATDGIRLASGTEVIKATTGAVDTTAILNGTIIAEDIATDGVGADEISAGVVGASEIAEDAVGNSELADDAVDTDNILDGAVTAAKLDTGITATYRDVGLYDFSVDGGVVGTIALTGSSLPINAVVTRAWYNERRQLCLIYIGPKQKC